MSRILFDILLVGVPAILAITLHEAAHGYAALALGDDTAKTAGRLSLNPLRHIDFFGTIILPVILVAPQLLLPPHQIRFLFGWAKPVPVAAWKFRNPRRGMAMVGAAGPAMNFFLAWLGALAFYLPGAYLPGTGPGGAGSGLGQFLFFFILFNLVLGLFNLLPIPPLDGGRIAVGVLPAPIAVRYARIERLGIMLVLVIVFLLPMLNAGIGLAFQAILTHVLSAALNLVFFLAGHHV